MQAEFFTYLSAFVTIILALSIANLLDSFHKLLRARRRVDWHPIPVIVAVLATLLVISEFFSLWFEFQVTSITMVRMLQLLATPLVIAFFAYAALPDEVPEEGIDLYQFYFEERRVLAALMVLAMFTDRAFRADVLTSFYDFFLTIVECSLFVIPAAIIAFTQREILQWSGVLLLSGSVAIATLWWDITLPG